MELLELRWHLSRIACMYDKGEDEDSDYDSDGGSVSVRSGSRSLIKKEATFPENIPFRPPAKSPSPPKLQNVSFEGDLSSSIVE